MLTILITILSSPREDKTTCILSRRGNGKIPILVNKTQVHFYKPKAYWEPWQTTKIKFLAKIVNGGKPLPNFVRRFILDIWYGSE